MKIEHAAQIVKKAIEARDAIASKDGLNSTSWTLRRVGSVLTREVEDIVDDVLAGKGVGCPENKALLLKVAKSMELTA